jgi:hypothetical protein
MLLSQQEDLRDGKLHLGKFLKFYLLDDADQKEMRNSASMHTFLNNSQKSPY